MGLGLSKEIEKFTWNQVSDVGCYAANVIGANLTNEKVDFDLQKLSITAKSPGSLERELDALLDNLFQLFLDSYDKAIPAFFEAFALAPLVALGNDKLNVLREMANCSTNYVVDDSAYPLDLVGSLAVLGGAVGMFIVVTIIVLVLHFVVYKIHDNYDDKVQRHTSEEQEEATRLIMSGPKYLKTDEALSYDATFDNEEKKLPPLGLDPRLPWIAKIGIPFLIIGTIGTLISSNVSVGASVYVFFHFGDVVISSTSLFSFGLANTIRDMWSAGVYPLSLLVAIFSGAWPYLKLLLMLVCWLAPIQVKFREKFLMFLDALGKWSLLDSLILIFMIVAFRFNLVIPGSPLAQTQAGDAVIDLVVQADVAYYTFLLGTMVSLVITHIILACHRWVEEQDAEVAKQAADDEVRALFNCKITLSDGTVVKCTKFGALFVAFLLLISFGLVMGGAYIDSFTFHFKGAAGAVFPYMGAAADRSYSLISVTLAIPEAALNANAFGTRWFQASFMFLCIVVPLAYLFVLFILWVVPMNAHWHGRVFVLAEICRAWASMEVFVLAVIVALTELSQFAKFLVGDRCDAINPILAEFFSGILDGDPTCFVVTTTLASGCWLMFSACVLYIFAGQIVITTCHALIEDRHVGGVKKVRNNSGTSRFTRFLRWSRFISFENPNETNIPSRVN